MKAIARDVVNTAHIKATLAGRSEVRHDAPVVASWLKKAFHRWIISTFEHATPLTDAEAYQAMTGEAAPAWLSEKVAADGEQPLVLIDPAHPHLMTLEQRCAEWLGVRAKDDIARKFPRMTPPHVLGHWREDHRLMAKRQASGIVETSGDALSTVLRRKGLHAVEFDPAHPEFRKELRNESVHMGHCIGQFADLDQYSGGYAEDYAAGAEAGEMRLFSIRDGRNAPHVTVALDKAEDTLHLREAKGKQNLAPIEKYADALRALLNSLKIEAAFHPDCAACGLFVQGGKHVTIDGLEDAEGQMRAVALRPDLALRVSRPSAAMKWLAMTSDPETAPTMRNPEPVMQLAAVLLSPDGAELFDAPDALLRDAAGGRLSGVIEEQRFQLVPFPAAQE